MLKAGDGLSIDCDAFLKHGQRPDPEGAVAVVGAVDDEGLLRFRVCGDSEDNVIPSFIVSVASGDGVWGVSGLGWLIHWCCTGVLAVGVLFEEGVEPGRWQSCCGRG